NLTRAPYTQLALESCIRGYDLEAHPRLLSTPTNLNEKSILATTLEFKKPDRVIETRSPMPLHMKNFCAKHELNIKRLLQSMKRDHESVNQLVHIISELFPTENTH